MQLSAYGDVSDLVQSITVETAWLPTITAEAPLAGPPSAILTWLKPKITVQLSTGQTITRAPYGEPGTSRWPLLAVVLLLGTAAGVGLLARRLLR